MSHGCSSLFPLSFCRAEVAATRGREGRPRTRMRPNCRLRRKTGRKVATVVKETRGSAVARSRGYAPRLRAAALSAERDKTRSCTERARKKISRENREEKREPASLLIIHLPANGSQLPTCSALTGKSSTMIHERLGIIKHLVCFSGRSFSR